MTDEETDRLLVATLVGYLEVHGRRELPWRMADDNGLFDPYEILVSEIMLQQTQVTRAITKYHEFLGQFPTVMDLADASLGDVLRTWQGLGYNRRAKFLWQAAAMVRDGFDGQLPADQMTLTNLPGVGVNTAGAVCAYAFDLPVLFIETNVRTVIIHHYFHDQTNVSDKVIALQLQRLLDVSAKEAFSPRHFYWAFMDYGSYLKRTVGNMSRSSSTYAKQSRFEGSKRQIRGTVIRTLSGGPQDDSELQALLPDDRLPLVITELLAERLIVYHQGAYHLA